MADLTVTNDYALAVRYNDAIDIAYVMARRTVKRYRQELDAIQGLKPNVFTFADALEAVHDAHRRSAPVADRTASEVALEDKARKALRSGSERKVPDLLEALLRGK